MKISSVLKTEKGRILLDQVVFSATSFLTTILLARQLGITQFGIYSVIILYLYLLLSISVSLVISPFQVVLARKENKRAYLAAVVRMQWLVTGCLLLVTVALLLTGFPFARELRGLLPEIVLLTAGFLLQDFYRRIFIGLQQSLYALIVDSVSGILQLSWLLFTFFTHTINLSYGLFIIGITYVPSILAGYLLLKKSCGKVSFFGADVQLHWLQGRWLLLTSFLQWWANNFLVAVSGIFLGIPALGALRLAQTLFGVLNAMFQVFENYAVPRAASLLVRSAGEMKCFLQDIAKKGLYLLLPVLLIIIFFPAPIFRLCGGQDYTGYGYALQGMAVLYLVIFIGYPVRIAVRVMMMNRAFFTAYLFAFVFTFFAAHFLVSQWQLTGVIASLIINQLIMLGYWQWMLARKKMILWK